MTCRRLQSGEQTTCTVSDNACYHLTINNSTMAKKKTTKKNFENFAEVLKSDLYFIFFSSNSESYLYFVGIFIF